MNQLVVGGGIHTTFEGLIRDANALKTSPDINLLKNISTRITNVSNAVNIAINEISVQQKQQTTALADANSKEVDAEQKHKESQKELNSVTAKLSGMESEVRSLQRDIDSLYREKRELEGKKEEEERKRRNMVEDSSVPFGGIINAFKTGDAKRAIPFYSEINGLISVISRDLENAESRLNAKNDELNRKQREINDKHDQKVKLEQKNRDLGSLVAKYHEQRGRAERNVQTIGKRLAILNDVKVLLGNTAGKCASITSKISDFGSDPEIFDAIFDKKEAGYLCDSLNEVKKRLWQGENSLIMAKQLESLTIVEVDPTPVIAPPPPPPPPRVPVVRSTKLGGGGGSFRGWADVEDSPNYVTVRSGAIVDYVQVNRTEGGGRGGSSTSSKIYGEWKQVSVWCDRFNGCFVLAGIEIYAGGATHRFGNCRGSCYESSPLNKKIKRIGIHSGDYVDALSVEYFD